MFAFSIAAVPAFADPVVRETPSTYTEVVPPDSNNPDPSTEVMINSEFHYLDYSPDIDVTYTWGESFEWTYYRNDDCGFWVPGAPGTLLDTIKKISSIVPEAEITAGQLEDIESIKLQKIAEYLEDFEKNQIVCKALYLTNNASNKVAVSLSEKSIEFSHTKTIGTRTVQPSTISNYLQYRTMEPITSGSLSTTTKATAVGTTNLSTSWTIGTNDSTKDYSDPNINKAIIGISPLVSFRPSDYLQWIAKGRDNTAQNTGQMVATLYLKCTLVKEE